jgi:hypothetical protein
MPAITQTTHNQVPIQMEDHNSGYSAEEESHEYHVKPDVVITGFGVSIISTFLKTRRFRVSP